MNSFPHLFKPFGAAKPYKGFAKLAIGNYEIEKFRLVKNKFAANDPTAPKKTVLVELADQVLFLPAYFSTNFNDDDKIAVKRR